MEQNQIRLDAEIARIRDALDVLEMSAIEAREIVRSIHILFGRQREQIMSQGLGQQAQRILLKPAVRSVSIVSCSHGSARNAIA
jgi:hypothetical protein